MYLVANSYPKGGDDFIKVFDIAVRMYPDDEVANLNAAAVALSKKICPMPESIWINPINRQPNMQIITASTTC